MSATEWSHDILEPRAAGREAFWRGRSVWANPLVGDAARDHQHDCQQQRGIKEGRPGDEGRGDLELRAAVGGANPKHVANFFNQAGEHEEGRLQ